MGGKHFNSAALQKRPGGRTSGGTYVPPHPHRAEGVLGGRMSPYTEGVRGALVAPRCSRGSAVEEHRGS